MTCQLTAVHQQGTKCPNGGFGSPDNAVQGFLVLVSLKGRLKSPPWKGKTQPSSYRWLVVQATPVQNWGFIFPKYFRDKIYDIWNHHLIMYDTSVLISTPPFWSVVVFGGARLQRYSAANLQQQWNLGWLPFNWCMNSSGFLHWGENDTSTYHFILTTGYVWISNSIYSCRSRSIYHLHLLKFFKRQAHANLRKMIYIEIWFAQWNGPKSDLAISSRGWLWNSYLCST